MPFCAFAALFAEVNIAVALLRCVSLLAVVDLLFADVANNRVDVGHENETSRVAPLFHTLDL